MELVCSAFDVHRSCYYEHRKRCRRIDAERVALKAKVNRLFNQSRSSAGSRTIQGLLNEQGGSWPLQGAQSDARTRADLQAARASCLQAGDSRAARYTEPSGSRIYGGKSEPGVVRRHHLHLDGEGWSYLAVVLDLYARRVVGWAISSHPDADLVVKALDHAWEQRGST